MAKYTFIVMTNSTAGKEAEFNEWYNQQHIPDVRSTCPASSVHSDSVWLIRKCAARPAMPTRPGPL